MSENSFPVSSIMMEDTCVLKGSKFFHILTFIPISTRELN